MTLVVARLSGDQIAMAADTLLTEHATPLSFSKGTVKICILPGNICVGFSNSPELAEIAFAAYVQKFPEGANFTITVEFFEKSSRDTENEYLIAFGSNQKLIKVVDGKRISSISKTVWIGDKSAYERFREVESRNYRRRGQGRAINMVLFGDEPNGSSASELYSTMSELLSDRTVPAVGGFVALASSRGPGFRFSIYSDTLFDWPSGRPETHDVNLNEKIALSATDENLNYSLTQIPSLYMDANYVGFYLLKGKMLFLFYGINNGLANKCHVVADLEPTNVAPKISELLGFDLSWLVLVVSSYDYGASRSEQDGSSTSSGGMRFNMMCHANTCPKDTGQGGLLRVGPAP